MIRVPLCTVISISWKRRSIAEEELAINNQLGRMEENRRIQDRIPIRKNMEKLQINMSAKEYC